MRAYISKLIDRNLQRKRESGFTTYALYSVLFIVVYKIFEIVHLIPFQSDFWEVIEILTYSINLLFSLRFIYLIYEGSIEHLQNCLFP